MSETVSPLDAAVARFRQGDRASRDELMTVMYERLRVLASRMLDDFARLRGRGEETGDVLHSAMLRFLRALESVRPTTTRDFLALAASQIRRELIDLARRHFGRRGHRAPPQKVGNETTLQAIAAAGAARLAETGVALAELHQQVEQLPEKEREVVDLLWYLDLTQDEAARVLGVDKSTVKRRWRDARQSLEKFVKDWGPLE
jgi:RNA polymerase sigma-70 factor (ECF subfamily)